jgi:hypothetical protein
VRPGSNRAGAVEAELMADRHPGPPPAPEGAHAIGVAKAAVTHAMYNGVAHEDMVLEELNPATGKFEVLFNISKGTPKTQMPW